MFCHFPALIIDCEYSKNINIVQNEICVNDSVSKTSHMGTKTVIHILHYRNMTANDFDKLGFAITEKYEGVVKSALDLSNIADFNDFYKVYHAEEKAVDEECVTPTKTTPKLKLFAEVFKLLDVHPPNLQKPKPKAAPAFRDRLNSTISRSSTSSLNDLSPSASITNLNQKDTSCSSLNLVTKYEDVTTKPSDTYKNFVMFQKQLKQLKLEMEQQSVEKEYELKLKQLNNFSQQLEKLLPSEKVGHSALTPDEENILSTLVEKMDDLNFIRANYGIFDQQNNPIFKNSQRLDSLVDILSHCLISATSFNIN